MHLFHAPTMSHNCVISQAAKSHNHAIAQLSKFATMGGMNDDLRQRRVSAFENALAARIADGTISSANDWCVRAGVPFSTMKNFRAGITQIMGDATYRKLAPIVGMSVAELKGERAERDDLSDILSDLRALPDNERQDIARLIHRLAAAHREHD